MAETSQGQDTQGQEGQGQDEGQEGMEAPLQQQEYAHDQAATEEEMRQQQAQEEANWGAAEGAPHY